MADNNGHEDGLAAGTGREQRRLHEQERRTDDEAAEIRAGIAIAVLCYLVVLILGFVWVVRG